MVRGFRAAVYQRLMAALPGDTAVYPVVPEDVAHLPCVVVGTVSVTESGVATVMDLELSVMILGARMDVGDTPQALDDLCDDVWAAFGWARGVKVDGVSLYATDSTGTSVEVAGQTTPAYFVTITSSYHTC